jgi:hypothetical protein
MHLVRPEARSTTEHLLLFHGGWDGTLYVLVDCLIMVKRIVTVEQMPIRDISPARIMLPPSIADLLIRMLLNPNRMTLIILRSHSRIISFNLPHNHQNTDEEPERRKHGEENNLIL